ncbi:hypothetical protein [Mesorhizobium sp.]|uniref:hypothetical protein n=1 Tax=Mesorhizobium sp. TaxID=1871066 RepID=UPI001203B991|nr:hypothetical protein [Mesorhizobium sp.]TIS87702.1 MAG: hypothetical protein E5W89_24015 [Mesorhizobium sp.]
MIAVDWFGPYDLEGAKKAANSDYGDGLYMCIGKRPYQRAPALQYVGIGIQVRTRLKEDHHKLQEVTKQRSMWLGEVVTAEPSGKKIKVTPATLDYAEWLHARFLRLPLNEKKTKGLPPRSVTVLNRWWRTDYATPRRKRPHPDWPDLIDYPSYGLPARLVWFGKGQRHILGPDYADPT